MIISAVTTIIAQALPLASKDLGKALTNSAGTFPTTTPACTGCLAKPVLVAQGESKAATSFPRSVAERALQDMIDGKLTPQQADRLIRAAVTTDGVLLKLLGALKWGAIASLPLLLTGDSNPRITQSERLTALLRRGDVHGFFDLLKGLAGHDGARVTGIEAIATLTASLLAAGKPHSASRVLQQIIGALNKEGLANLGSGNATDLALEAAMAAYRRRHPAQPVLGPPAPSQPIKPEQPGLKIPTPAPARAVPFAGLTAADALRAKALGTARGIVFNATLKVQSLQGARQAIFGTYRELIGEVRHFYQVAAGGKAAAPQLAPAVQRVQALHESLTRQVAALSAPGGPVDQLMQNFSEVLKAAQKLGVEVTDLGLNDGDRQRIESLITSMPPYTGLFTASVLPGVKQFIGQANAYAQAVGSGQTLAQAAAKFPAMPVTIAHLGESVSANQLTQIAKGLTGAYEQALKRVQQLIDRPATGSVAEFTNQGKPVSPLPKPGHATSPQKKSVDDFSPLQRPMKLADSNDIEKMARQYNVSPDDIAAYMQQHGVSAEKAALDMNAQLLASRKGDNAVKEIGSRPPDGRSPTATAPPDSGPAWKPSPEAVLKRQADIYKKIRDNYLTGENITVQVDGKTLDAAALDRELVASNGKPTGFTARDMVRLAGSLKDATINIKLHNRAISIIQRHPQLEGSNKLTVYLDLKTVYFINLKVNQTSSRPGFGTALRMQQLVAAEKLGMRGATMTAARSKDYPTGYFTWPKFGFDAELPNKVKPDLTAYLLANPDVAKRLGLKPDALPTHLMLSELLFNTDGSEHQGLQAWWKAKGIGTDMGINFSGPSGARFRKMARDMGWLR